jgi:hypothetical protein
VLDARRLCNRPGPDKYEVNGKKFDGYDAKRNVLIDAKDYSTSNPLVTGMPPALATKFKNAAIIDAKDQISKAGGAKVEWHVASQQAANKLNEIFDNDPSLKNKITVVWNPDVVN